MSLETVAYFSLKLVLLILMVIITFCLIVRYLASRRPIIFRYESEKIYLDRESNSKRVFPFMDSTTESEATLYLSVIVPAYNEESRLPSMLKETIEYLESRAKARDGIQPENLPYGHEFTYEVIVVDDGSQDKTSQVALSYSDSVGVDKVRVLTLAKNRGKGGAVRLGVLSSRGRLVLFADADGATKFADLEKLEAAFLAKEAASNSIVIGSRAHLEEEAIATRSSFRTFLMLGFHFLVWFFTVRTVRDTQCGFKLFGRKVARLLFTWVHVERWAFDVELLYLAEKVGIRVEEVAVNWTEIGGSKLVPVFSWLQMGKDVISIFFMYAIGAWAAPPFKTLKSS